MLACNQNGVMGSQVYEKDGLEAWKVEKKDSPVEGWIGIFNRTEDKTSIELTTERLGIDAFSHTFFDVWENKPFNARKVELGPHDCAFFHYKKENR
jgi:hypothetical protein